MLLDNLDSKLENPVYESEMEYLDDLEVEEEIAFEESLELDESDIDAILNGDDDIPDEYEGYDANESFMALESDFDDFDFGIEGCESDEFDEDDDFDIDDFDEDDIDEEGIRDAAHNLNEKQKHLQAKAGAAIGRKIGQKIASLPDDSKIKQKAKKMAIKSMNSEKFKNKTTKYRKYMEPHMTSAEKRAVGYESDMSFEEEFDSAIESVLGGDFLDSLDNYDTAFEDYDLEESLEALTAALEESEEDDFEMDEEGCATEEDDDFGFDDFEEDDIDEEGIVDSIKNSKEKQDSIKKMMADLARDQLSKKKPISLDEALKKSKNYK